MTMSHVVRSRLLACVLDSTRNPRDRSNDLISLEPGITPIIGAQHGAVEHAEVLAEFVEQLAATGRSGWPV